MNISVLRHNDPAEGQEISPCQCVKVPIAAWSSLQFHRDTTLQLHQIVDYHTIQTSFHLMLLYWDSHPLQLNSRWASVTVRWTNHRLITDCRNVKSKKDDTRKLATVGECGRTESSDERNYAIKIMCDSYFIGASSWAERTNCFMLLFLI